MHRQWRLWRQGSVVARVENITPYLASWDAKTHPAQRRLHGYLERLAAELTPRLPDREDLFVHLDIDVRDPQHLLHHHDLENYLTPVVAHLEPRRFVFASALKRVGAGTIDAATSSPTATITVGVAQPWHEGEALPGWTHLSHAAGAGAAKPEWKAGLWAALKSVNYLQLPPGPVAVHLAWRCALGEWWPQRRNWVGLWKPTGDAMGPVLGPLAAQQPGHPGRFNPHDDRIVSLGLHLNGDESLGYAVDVGMWWWPWAESGDPPG